MGIADLAARHDDDVAKLAAHNRSIAKALEDEKKRRQQFVIAQEVMTKHRQRLETAVMESGEAVRQLEGLVDRDLITERDTAQAEARSAAHAATMARGRLTNAKLAYERLRGLGADADQQTKAAERVTACEEDVAKAEQKVATLTEKALRAELAVNKAKKEIVDARGNA